MRNVLLSALVLALGLPACSGCSEKAKDAQPAASAMPAGGGTPRQAPTLSDVRAAGLRGEGARLQAGPGGPVASQPIMINGKRVMIRPTRRLNRLPNGELGPARLTPQPTPAAPEPTPAPQQ